MRTLLSGLVLAVSATVHAQQAAAAAPQPMILNSVRSPGPLPSGFLANRTNHLLATADIAVRMSDGLTTWAADGSGYCSTCHETELPAALSRSLPGMLAYSAGMHFGLELAARQLWKRGHPRLARLTLLADIGGDGFAVGQNINALRKGGGH